MKFWINPTSKKQRRSLLFSLHVWTLYTILSNFFFNLTLLLKSMERKKKSQIASYGDTIQELLVVRIDPPSREKHTPLFLNTEHEAKQSACTAAWVPPHCASKQRDAGRMESRCSGGVLQLFTLLPWKDVKDYLCYLPGKRRDVFLRGEWKMSTKS